MAKVKKQDIKELSTEELVQKVKDEKVRYDKLKFAHIVSGIESPISLRHVRKDIARYSTELSNRMKKEIK